MSGICLVNDASMLLCTVQLNKAKRLLILLPSPLAQIPDLESDGSSMEKSRAFMEECEELIFDPDMGER
jgi:hypothetical protein